MFMCLLVVTDAKYIFFSFSQWHFLGAGHMFSLDSLECFSLVGFELYIIAFNEV